MPRKKIIPAVLEAEKDEFITGIFIGADHATITTQLDSIESTGKEKIEHTLVAGDALIQLNNILDEQSIWKLIEDIESGKITSKLPKKRPPYER